MEEKRILFIIILSLLILFPLVIAQPAPQQGADNFATGFELEFTQIETLKVNQTHLFNVHVLNISNGVRIDDDTTECDFHLFNSSGHHVLDQEGMAFNIAGQDWEIETLGGNFSSIGQYSYLVVCQDSTNELGGFVSVGIKVTPSGFDLEESQIIYSVLLIIIFLMDLLFLFIIFSLSLENPRGEDGNFIGISLKKYIKVVMIGVFYGLILLTLNLMNAMAQSISGISQFAGIIGGVFLLMLSMAWVWTLGIMIWIITIVWKDSNFIKEIEKNIKEIEEFQN